MSLPVRMGIAGLGRRGAYHFERLLLRDDFRITAVFDEPSRSAFAERHGCRRHADRNAFLSDESFDVALLATGAERHSETVVAALHAGKHVVVEPPLAFTAREAAPLITAARSAHRLLGVVEMRRGDGDFRTALDCLHAESLGTLVEAKFCRWGPALMMAEGEEASPRGRLWRLAGPLLDQALQLAGSAPVSVTARGYGAEAADGLAATLTFPEGRIVTIDVDARSLATLQTGWTVLGTHGTYHQGRVYAAAADGEVFDVPVESRATDPDEWLGDLQQRLANPARWLESAEQHAQVVRTVEALLAAMHDRRTVDIEPSTPMSR